jgi:hypothetical protein
MRFLPLLSGWFLVIAFVSPLAAAAPAAVDSASLRAEMDAALDRDDVPAAWFAAHRWLELAPQDPATHLAAARLYLRLDAPAAAISAAGAGLSLPLAASSSNPALTRSLLALKAQAHLAVNEPAPAWAAFSRLVASASPADNDDPLVNAARRARWDAFAQLAAADSSGRFFARLSDAAARPDAPAAAHLALALWLQANDDSAGARRILRAALEAQPASRELQAGFADLLFAQVIALDDSNAIRALFAEIAPDLKRLRTATPADPLALALIADNEEIFLSSLDAPKFTEPADLAAAATAFAATLPQHRARLAAKLTQAVDALAAFDLADDETPPTPATLAAREPSVAKHRETLAAGIAEVDRLNDTQSSLIYALSARSSVAAPADKPALEAALAKLQALAEASTPADEALIAARQTFTNLSRRVAENRQRARELAVRAALSDASTPDALLAATDAALLIRDQSALVWRKRFELALATQDLSETLANGARALTAEIAELDQGLSTPLPAATAALLDRLETLTNEAPRLVAEASAAWEAGQPEIAFTRLDRALVLDPALPSAWLQRWRWSEAAGDHAAAVQALDRWWRLDDRAPVPFTEAFATASRAGAWELLRSLSEARLEIDPADPAAILFRAHASLALDQTRLARDLVGVLDLSHHRAQGAFLRHVAENLTPSAPSFDSTLYSFLNKPDTPPGLDLWLGWCSRRTKALNATKLDPADEITIIPSSIHRDRLNDRVSPADYLARTAGTPEESRAHFINFLLASSAALTPEVRELGERVVKDSDLPLILRALAHRTLLLDDPSRASPALRASDLFHARHAPDPKRPWGAPGQEILISGAVKTADYPAHRPLRLRGHGTFPPSVEVSAADRRRSEPVSRLLAFRGVSLSGPGLSDSAIKPLLSGHAVEFTRGTVLIVHGTARFVASRFLENRVEVASGARLDLRDCDASLTTTRIAGTWTSDGGELRFAKAPAVEAGARLTHTGTVLTGEFPFPTPAGAQVRWRDLVASTGANWPDSLPAGWQLDGVRIVAAAATVGPAIRPLPAPHRGQHYVVAAPNAAAAVTVTSLDELQEALRSARPGAVLALQKGEYSPSSPLLIPPGVSLVGQPGARILVPFGSTGAFTLTQPGAARLRDLDVEHHDPTRTASTYTPDLYDKTLFILGADTWMSVHGGSQKRWFQETHHFADLGARARLELHDRRPLERVQLAADAKRYYRDVDRDPIVTLRLEIARHSREQLWADAARRFEAQFSRATNLTERSAAVREFDNAIGEVGRLTQAGTPASTRALIKTLLPAVQRYPNEAVTLYCTARHLETSHIPTHRAALPDSLKAAMQRQTAAFNEANRIGLNRVSVETVLEFQAAYPPGSPDYAAARAALERGLTPAQFQAEQAAQRQKNAELAAALAERLKAQAAANALATNRYTADRARYGSAFSGSGSGSGYYTGPTARTWSASNISVPPLAPAWTPSASQQMSNYRHNLDVQIMGATRRY